MRGNSCENPAMKPDTSRGALHFPPMRSIGSTRSCRRCGARLKAMSRGTVCPACMFAATASGDRRDPRDRRVRGAALHRHGICGWREPRGDGAREDTVTAARRGEPARFPLSVRSVEPSIFSARPKSATRTSPRESKSRLPAGNKIVSFFGLSTTGIPGYEGSIRHYAIEAAPNLVTGPWNPVPGYTDIIGNNTTAAYPTRARSRLLLPRRPGGRCGGFGPSREKCGSDFSIPQAGC